MVDAQYRRFLGVAREKKEQTPPDLPTDLQGALVRQAAVDLETRTAVLQCPRCDGSVLVIAALSERSVPAFVA
jgi:hypothetical protein